jgi:hypothetical protein
VRRHRSSHLAERATSSAIRKPLLLSLALVSAWRVIIGVCGIVAHYTLRPGPNFHSGVRGAWQPTPFNLLVDPYVRLDAFWYASVAQHGYAYSANHISSIGYFPLYPVLIKLISLVVGNAYVAGTLVSTACVFLAVTVLTLWLEFRGMARAAPLATVALLCFPFSFFLAAMYTDSLYLLLALAALACFERQRWYLAATATFFVVLARPTGVVLLISFSTWLISTHRRAWRPWVPIAAGAFGLFAFAGYQYAAFGTPIAYLKTQASPETHATLSAGLSELLLRPSPGLPSWYLGLMLVVAVIMLSFVPLAFRRFGSVAALFASLSVLLPTITVLYSLGRQCTAAFPIFAAAATTRHRLLLTGVLVVSLWAEVLLAMYFEAGYGLF